MKFVTARHGIKKEAPSCAWRKNTSLLSLSSLGHFYSFPILVPQEKRPLETEFLRKEVFGSDLQSIDFLPTDPSKERK